MNSSRVTWPSLSCQSVEKIRSDQWTLGACGADRAAGPVLPVVGSGGQFWNGRSDRSCRGCRGFWRWLLRSAFAPYDKPVVTAHYARPVAFFIEAFIVGLRVLFLTILKRKLCGCTRCAQKIHTTPGCVLFFGQILLACLRLDFRRLARDGETGAAEMSVNASCSLAPEYAVVLKT